MVFFSAEDFSDEGFSAEDFSEEGFSAADFSDDPFPELSEDFSLSREEPPLAPERTEPFLLSVE